MLFEPPEAPDYDWLAASQWFSVADLRDDHPILSCSPQYRLQQSALYNYNDALPVLYQSSTYTDGYFTMASDPIQPSTDTDGYFTMAPDSIQPPGLPLSCPLPSPPEVPVHASQATSYYSANDPIYWNESYYHGADTFFVPEPLQLSPSPEPTQACVQCLCPPSTQDVPDRSLEEDGDDLFGDGHDADSHEFVPEDEDLLIDENEEIGKEDVDDSEPEFMHGNKSPPETNTPVNSTASTHDPGPAFVPHIAYPPTPPQSQARPAPATNLRACDPPTPTRKSRKANSWSDEEDEAAIVLMKEVAGGNAEDSLSSHGGRESRFERVSFLMHDRYGFERGTASVKNQWNRYLREKSGFEDRGNKKRSTGLVTSALKSSKKVIKVVKVERRKRSQARAGRAKNALEQAMEQEAGALDDHAVAKGTRQVSEKRTEQLAVQQSSADALGDVGFESLLTQALQRDRPTSHSTASSDVAGAELHDRVHQLLEDGQLALLLQNELAPARSMRRRA